MARYGTRTPQTASQRMTTAIIMIVMALITLVIGLVQYRNSQSLMDKCTQTAVGSVVSVDSRMRHRRRGGSYTEYKAQIKMVEGSGFAYTEVYTDWTRHQFYRDQAVRIFFDPNDTTSYYIEAAPPENGIGMFFVAGVCMIIGAYSFIRAKRTM